MSTALKLEPMAVQAPRATSDVQVTPVLSVDDREAFIQFPYDLYEGNPHWVPPLIMERREFLSPEKNPWFEFGTAELFLARRNGQVVGRIAAIHDRRYNEFHQIQTGAFGMFECIEDVTVAAALFEAAGNWCRAQGFETMWGPVNFSTNQECGVLVEGFEFSPYLMLPYNPRYYPELYERCGLTKAKDLWGWELSSSVPPPEKVVRVAEKIRQREGITIRHVNLKDYANEVKRLKEIYNAAWEKNWGFVPMTEKEFDHLAANMKQMVVPELLLIAEVKGEPVAFSMTLPDANVALKAAGGRLTTFGLPIGLARLLWASRSIKHLRVVTMGIKQGYRRRGIDSIMYLDTLTTARKLGYEGGELSWTLEDNVLINRAIESMGARKYKTFRLYEKKLS